MAVAGRDAGLAVVASAVADALRVHNTGGPLALPLLAAHADVAATVVDAILAAVAGCLPAPLPTEPLRQRALPMRYAVGQ